MWCLRPLVITKVLLTRDGTYPTVRTPKGSVLEGIGPYQVRVDFLVRRVVAVHSC